MPDHTPRLEHHPPLGEPCLATVDISAGTFAMGDREGRPDEQPPHEVYVDAFWMCVTPVTNAAYRRFVAATGHAAPPFWNDPKFRANDQPVVGTSWFDAVAFCAWLSRETGDGWRLPTEAERERAARGGIEGARYPWGDHPGPHDGRFEQDAPFAVALGEPNAFGLYDMGYNVHEWCSDWYGATYYAIAPRDNPQGPLGGIRRASRGGAWRHQVKVARCAARSSLPPDFHYNDYSFRPMRTP